MLRCALRVAERKEKKLEKHMQGGGANQGKDEMGMKSRDDCGMDSVVLCQRPRDVL